MSVADRNNLILTAGLVGVFMFLTPKIINFTAKRTKDFRLPGGFSLEHITGTWKLIKSDLVDDPLKLARFWTDTTNSHDVVDGRNLSVDEIKRHIEFGEMVMIAYIVLNLHEGSENYGKSFIGSEFNMNKLVSAIFPGNVVQRILKTSAENFGGVVLNDETFMGFVSYNAEKREANIVFRGTVLLGEWFADASVAGEKWYDEDGESTIEKALDLILRPPVKTLVVHQGFKNMYTTLRKITDRKTKVVEKVRESSLGEGVSAESESPRIRAQNEIKTLIMEGKIDTINTVGHSLGAALAFITAIDMDEFINTDTDLKALNWKGKINAVTFACPKVAAKPYINEHLAKSRINFFHYLNRGDVVPTFMPGKIEHPDGMIKRRFDPAAIQVISPNLTSKLWHIAIQNVTPSHTLIHIMYNMWATVDKVNPGCLGNWDPEVLNMGGDLLPENSSCPPNWFNELLKDKLDWFSKGLMIDDADDGVNDAADSKMIDDFIALYKRAWKNPKECAAEVAALMLKKKEKE